MNRIILCLIVLLGAVSAVAARDFSVATRIDSIDRELAVARQQLAVLDEDYYKNQVWGRGRYTSIGFVLVGNTDNESLPREYTSFGVFFNQGTSYLFPHGRGFGSFIKVGIDARWVDVELTTYDRTTRDLTYSSDVVSGTGFTRYPARILMRRMTLTGGLCGIGPVVSIAPFSWSNNGMSSIKLTAYAHYIPSYTFNFYRGTPADLSGERIRSLNRGPWVTEAAYVNMFDFGAKLQWSRFAVGVEGRHGWGQFPDRRYRLNPANPFYLNNDGRRYRRTLITTRFTLSYSF